MRIDAKECIEIIAMATGDEFANRMKKHLDIYNDWGRVKHYMQNELSQIRLERDKATKKCKELHKKVEELQQESFIF